MSAEAVIKKMLTLIDRPLGDTPEERIENAAKAIRAILEKLPADERDDAVYGVVGGSGRWFRKASWAP